MTTNFSWPVASPHLINITVSNDDIDGLSHTNNGCYVNWCERAAWSHSEALGLSVQDYQQLDRGMAVFKAEYQYLSPSVADDILQIATWLSYTAGSRMQREFLIRRESDNKDIVRAHWQLACIELSSGRPKKLPQAFLDCYLPAVIQS